MASFKDRLNVDPHDKSAKEMVDLYMSFRERDQLKYQDVEWQKDNLEYDLLTTDWVLEKVRHSESYAQNLYAAMCNNEFMKLDVIPLLKEEKWSCSWRYAGGIIANMRQQGDYIDWYCSGIRNDDSPLQDSGIIKSERNNITKLYVSESVVTDEIKTDLMTLGWLVSSYEDDSI